MKIDWQKHPQAHIKTIKELEEEVFMTSVKHGALVIRGSWFRAECDAKQETMFFRATFAAAPFHQIQEAIRRFGVAVRESFGLSQTNGVSHTNGVVQTNGYHA
jgi:aromatic amino acid aminotransferase I